MASAFGKVVVANNPIGGASPQPTPQPQKVTAVSKPVVKNTQPVHGKFLSGGIVSKGLDVLNSGYYGLAGFGKGWDDQARKTQASGGQMGLPLLPKALGAGIKGIGTGIGNRAQFSDLPGDYNLMGRTTDNKNAQAIGNFASSLAVPALPIAKGVQLGTKVLSKIPAAVKAGEAISRTAGKVGTATTNYIKANPEIAHTVEKIPGLEYIRNPQAGKIINDFTENASRRVSGLYNQINDVAKKLTAKEREQVGLLIEGKHPGNAPAHLVTHAKNINQISDRIGQEVVNEGLMSPESFAKFKGKYLAHIAEDVVKNPETRDLPRKMLSYTSSSLKQRKDKLGKNGLPDYIREFQYPAFKALSGEIQNVESAKALKQVAGQFGKIVNPRTLIRSIGGPRTTKDGMVYLKDIEGIPPAITKQLKSVAVPKEIAEYITRKYSKENPQGLSGLIGSAIDKGTNAWKLGKTIYSGPAYHIRNLMSNQVLSDAQTHAGLPATIANYIKSVRAYNGKGDPKLLQYMQELKDNGVINHMNIAKGTKDLRPDVFKKSESIKSLVKEKQYGQAAKNIARLPMRLQQGMEGTSKLNVYSHFRNQGMGIKEAMKKAEEAIFSPYNISQNEKSAVRDVIPFYSFTRQAAPFIGKAAVRNGNTFTKYDKTKTAVESLSPEGAYDQRPQGGKQMVRLPYKDKYGKYIYADPTYTLPYGNFEQGVEELGGSTAIGKQQLPLGLALNPLITETASSGLGGLFGTGSNKDSYFGTDIAKKGETKDRAAVERAAHAYQTFAPNFFPTIPSGQVNLPIETRGVSKLYNAFTNKEDYAGRTRGKLQAVLDSLGLKSTSVSPDQPRFDALSRKTQLSDMQSRRKTILKGKNLNPEQRKKIIQQFNDEIKKILNGQ